MLTLMATCRSAHTSIHPRAVLEDADLDHATEVALRGVFVNCGQNCIAAERIYVHKSILPKYIPPPRSPLSSPPST